MRKRIYKNLEEYPHHVAWKRYFDTVMYAIAVLSPLATVPQLLEVFLYKHVAGISLTSWITYGVLNVVWIAYGMVHKEVPIILSNLIFFFLNFAIVGGVFLFR